MARRRGRVTRLPRPTTLPRTQRRRTLPGRRLQTPRQIQRPTYQGPGIASRQQIRVTGRQAFAAGNHPQMWRTGQAGPPGSPPQAGMNLGRSGTFESETIILIQINYQVLQLYQTVVRVRTGGRERFYERDVYNLVFRKFFKELLQPFMFSIINRFVPRDSGRLRNAMEIAVRDHSATGSLNPFHVVIDTGNIEYARPVNQMPNAWLKHPGTHIPGQHNMRRTRRGRKKAPANLYDPNAVTNWFQRVRDDGRDMAAQLWRGFLSSTAFRAITKEIQQEYGLTAYQVGQSLFSVRFN